MLPSINPAWLVGTAIATAFVIVYPVVLAIIANQRLKVGWRFFGYGAIIFFVFQLITRVPLVALIQARIGPQLKSSMTLLIGWTIVLALSAGLFEEVGRYVGYRVFMKHNEKTWGEGVMYGLGHGGLESMLFVGGQLLLTLVNIIALSTINLNTLPAAQHALIVRQIAAINAQPAWTTLLSAWERLWTVPFHVAMSLIVLQVFRRNNIAWLFLAILLHALTDFVSAILPIILGGSLNTSLIIEAVVALFGLIAIWIIWKLRDHPTPSEPSAVPSTEPVAPDASF